MWERYNIEEDYSLSNNLAATNQAKLEELKKLFMTEGVKYKVLPIDDRSIERFDAKIAGRPDLMGGRKKLTLYPGATRMMENAFINMKNTSYTITADVEVTGGNTGALICQGGDFGGWSLFMKDGKPQFTYNWMGIEKYDISSGQKLAPGKHTVKFEFQYEGGRGKGGKGILYVDGSKVAEGMIKQTHSNTFGVDETADLGTDSNTPVTEAYHHHPSFNGKINKVTIEVM